MLHSLYSWEISLDYKQLWRIWGTCETAESQRLWIQILSIQIAPVELWGFFKCFCNSHFPLPNYLDASASKEIWGTKMRSFKSPCSPQCSRNLWSHKWLGLQTWDMQERLYTGATLQIVPQPLQQGLRTRKEWSYLGLERSSVLDANEGPIGTGSRSTGHAITRCWMHPT